MSRMNPPVVVWPEGQPEKATLCHTWLGAQWKLLGFPALFAMRRMVSAWPVADGENPVVIARNCERRLRQGLA